MKKLIRFGFTILSIFLICFTIYYFFMQKDKESPEVTLMKSFNESGARLVSSEVYFYGRISKENGNAEKTKEIVTDFANSIGVIKNDAFSEKDESSDIVQKIEINGVTAEKVTVNVTAKLTKGGVDAGNNYISVDVVGEITDLRMEDIKKQVLQVFENYKIGPKINSTIIGSFDGKVENSRLNDICKKIFNDVEAEKVEGINDRNLISVSAYSPFIKDTVSVNGNRVNLNVAIRYNSFEDRTYIWLATPIITTEY